MGKVKITDTTLRDGHQSLIATRLTTAEILPAVEMMDKVGYHSLEVWGGATFDSAIRFLNEDPWERLREIRKRAKNTKLQMLLRGQNLLGYRHYADDIVDRFIEKSVKNGIDIIRIFDALNDVRNIRQACESTKKYGGHSQLAICYTISPVHTTEYFKNLAKEMENMGADSIAVKDMSGILLPYKAYELISELKKTVKVPIELHTHATAGLGAMTNLKGIEAGVDIVDTALSPLSGGTSQPTTESLVRTLQGTEYDTGFDLELLKEIAEYFKPIRKKYLDNGTLNPQALFVEPSIVEYQLPGGMLSNMLSQLKAQKAEHKYEEVLKEIPKVRADLGYPPLVTPLSQMVGTQSVFNVLTGSRYKMIPKEIKDYVKGLYGKSPVPISEEMKKTVIGEEELFTGRPADLINSEYEAIENEAGDLTKSVEDVLMYAMFPQTARPYLENRNNPEKEKKEEVKEQTINVIF
ncbi:MAG: oxaloacetate decarboxylase subunit alpha [Leptotrichiaceae bacterium]|nr:oxaloacetate decarboxylase subunit alpha [Leptotrichiaceae bacterium]